MAGSPYAVALGRLKPDFTSFLAPEAYPGLVAAKEVSDIANLLEPTVYGPSLDFARATYQGALLLEVAINRTFVRRNRHAYEATPFAGRQVVGAYLTRYDLQNVEMILAAKAQGRSVRETEDHLVSSRDIPAGLYAGVMTLDDVRNVLAQPTIEATVSALVKFGYGHTILPFLENFERTHDIFPILHALDAEYYRNVLASARFFQGDEWIVRGLLQSEIDLRNALLLLKGKAADLPLEEVSARWLDGGQLSSTAAPDLYASRGVPELAERLAGRFPTIGDGAAEYTEHQSLTGYEVALARDRAVAELKRLRTYPLSLGVIFAYLLRAELERDDLRRVVFGRAYGIAPERLTPLLVSARL